MAKKASTARCGELARLADFLQKPYDRRKGDVAGTVRVDELAEGRDAERASHEIGLRRVRDESSSTLSLSDSPSLDTNALLRERLRDDLQPF